MKIVGIEIPLVHTHREGSSPSSSTPHLFGSYTRPGVGPAKSSLQPFQY
jgi:hypothetical protein